MNNRSNFWRNITGTLILTGLFYWLWVSNPGLTFCGIAALLIISLANIEEYLDKILKK